MNNILVIEDEDIAANRLIQMLRKLVPGASIYGPLESVTQSIEYLSTNLAPDLILLDIHLADGLSFNIFQQIKIPSPIIFTTAFDEYAIRAFELNSIDYLLKPIDINKLKNSIDKFNTLTRYFGSTADDTLKELITSIKTKRNAFKNRFLVSKGDALIPLTTEDIAYFIAEEKLVFLYTINAKKYIINYTLDALEAQLNPQHFFRINRQCILNSNCIIKVHNYFNYKLKIEVQPPVTEELIVSKSRTSEFKNWMNN